MTTDHAIEPGTRAGARPEHSGSVPSTGRIASLLAGTTVTLLALVPAAALWSPLPAGAIGSVGGNTPFGVQPSPTAAGLSRSFFSFNLAAGQADHDSVTITNSSKSTRTFDVAGSDGTTTPTSGNAYVYPASSCAGVGCWISGLPPTVTLAAGAQVQVPFTVTVPAGTTPRQYLGGVSVKPSVPTPPVRVGSNGNGASAQATVVSEVDIGVAITVGNLAQLTPKLTIPDVRTTSVGSTPRFLIDVRNGGSTFLHATGTVRADVSGNGKPLIYPVTMNTVLPGHGATLPINAPHFTGNDIEVEVHLTYADGQAPAIWKGKLSAAAPKATPPVATLPSAKPAKSTSVIPGWVIVLIIVLAVAVLAALAMLVLLLVRSRRSQPGSPTEPTQHAADQGGRSDEPAKSRT